MDKKFEAELAQLQWICSSVSVAEVVRVIRTLESARLESVTAKTKKFRSAA
jgi:hypothetical protein